MDEFPFQLAIKSKLPDRQRLWLSCGALLRAIPGKREVYEAVWGNQSVIVKLFRGGIGGKRRLYREWRGLVLLQQRGLSAPAPLFCGRTQDGRWAAVQERIADSCSVLEAFSRLEQQADKVELLAALCVELARQHSKGVLQKDLHLGNFLVKDGRLFAIDPGGMRFFRGAIGRKRSISNLALLACCLADWKTESILTLCELYCRQRNWHFGQADGRWFEKQMIKHKTAVVRRSLKKCLRTSKRYVLIKAGRHAGVFAKSFCQGDEARDFLGHIDRLMGTGVILKDGNTCYVSRVRWNGTEAVVKRYNHKGFVHSLRHTLKRSRARQGWLNAHRLRALGIATAQPLAYIEQRRGPLVWQSYLVSEYVEGQKLDDFLRDEHVSVDVRSGAIRQVMALIDNMGRQKISHGDLKHSNILLTDKGPVLIDLDGMKVHRWQRTYEARRTRDLECFVRRDEHGEIVGRVVQDVVQGGD